MEPLDVVVPVETGAEVDPSKIEQVLKDLKGKFPKMDDKNMQ